MIHYNNQSWWGLVFRYQGTIWESTWSLVICIVVLLLIAYWGEVCCDVKLGTSGHTIFGSTMSYLLVFRAQSASERYWHGRGNLTQAFFSMREFVMLMCVTLKGGAAGDAWRESRMSQPERAKLEDANDIRASMARVNCVRWALAFVVSLKLHTRICYSGFLAGWISAEQKWLIDWDRIRLRGLMTRHEFEELNDLVPIIGEQHVTRGAMALTPELIEEVLRPPGVGDVYEVNTTPDLRQPLAILIKIRLEITRHMNEPYGFKERFAKDVLNLCNQAAVMYESITMLITTPIPFPYVHLCKVLLLIFLASMAFMIDPGRGLFASVAFPSCVAMALLGIDAIATQLENPFGDDRSDHDVVGAIGALEAECLLLLELSGDVRARSAFVALAVPPAPHSDGHPPLPRRVLCLRNQLRTAAGDAVVVSADGAGAGAAAAQAGRRPTPAGVPGRRAGVRGRHASFEIPDGGGDDPRRPLLGSGADSSMAGSFAGSQTGFLPMREFGTETLVLEEQAGGGPTCRDNVGLSDDETLQEEEEQQQSCSALSASPHSSLAAMSPTRRSRPVGSGEDDIKASAQGFRPMAEFGTQTIVFEERPGDDEIGLDVIGLSEEEEEEDEEEEDNFGRFLRRSGISLVVRANFDNEQGMPLKGGYGDHAFEPYGIAQANIRVEDHNGGLPQPRDIRQMLEVCEGYMVQKGGG
eukprot:CAMPEP_0179209918 /NCGR_PEP_ID=MMETSP0796-20121207/104695_1 /TAXON_ID=73915 /ORGANISM="Pyrodinium bahamense, Strain pbaha01" /LENGTH=695 /DNA_ID=CAMNT_0020914879 /DNA_START=1 /DNA_END=2085 /DNA_ORIENTATION=+